MGADVVIALTAYVESFFFLFVSLSSPLRQTIAYRGCCGLANWFPDVAVGFGEKCDSEAIWNSVFLSMQIENKKFRTEWRTIKSTQFSASYSDAANTSSRNINYSCTHVIDNVYEVSLDRVECNASR